jgi:hypothetical protein
MNFLKLARVTALKEPPGLFDTLIRDFFLRRNPLLTDNPDLFIAHPDADKVYSPVSTTLSHKNAQKISKYNGAIEVANNSIVFKPIGCDLYGELSTDTINLFGSIASFAAAPKGISPFYYLNRFYNNLSFVFANENSNIISELY